MTAKKAKEITDAEAGVQAAGESSELRTGLATGSNAANPDQPDGNVLQTTVVPSSPDEDTSVGLSVLVTADGKKGPAA